MVSIAQMGKTEALNFAKQAGRGDLSALETLLREMIGDVLPAVVNLTAATLTLDDETHDGRLVTVNRAAGSTITLPAATGSGAKYRVFVGTTVTSNNVVIQVANATDTMVGGALVMADAGDSTVGFEAAGTHDTVTLNGTTTGGIKGDEFTFEDVASGLWKVTGVMSATGTEATPFSAAVS